ncbi:MAG: hypothetical protein NZO58_09105 [Gemmataceae bacterium]|nr:hypothetical protein [Gemmataceae bacterium]
MTHYRTGLWTGVALAVALAGLPSLGNEPLSLTFDRLVGMSWGELQALYAAAGPGTMPRGFVRGKSLYPPCAVLAGPRTHLANGLWKGKHFCPDDASLINQWCGIRAIRAQTYRGESWFDGKPALVLDYHDTSFVWRDARDEMREVAPGLYVGLMYLRRCPEPRIKTMFVLEACACPTGR